MWTCGEIKSRARATLKRYYWIAFLVCFIASVLGAGNSGSTGAGSGIGTAFTGLAENISQTTQGSGSNQTADEYFDQDYADLNEALAELQSDPNSEIATAVVIGVAGIVFVIGMVIALCWTAFVVGPVQVGVCRFFIESREKGASAGVGRLFYSFERGKYLNTVKVMFLQKLFIGLWSLLLIIPGVIKMFEYAMVPYILAENPAMDYKTALRLSKDMMDGNKFHLFVLNISFIGWYILGTLCCGFGLMFVTPYVEAAKAELYAELRSYPCN